MIRQEGYAYAYLNAIYPLLVQQFVDDYDLMDGVAFDIGTGPGFLGIELAKITNMKICFLDGSKQALDTAQESFSQIGADNEVDFIRTRVEKMEVEDNVADFVMSRGSLWFWDDQPQGLKEIYRILKPGGVAVVGGGLGRYMPDTMRRRIMGKIQARLIKNNKTRPTLGELAVLGAEAGLMNIRVFDDGESKGGRWIEIKK